MKYYSYVADDFKNEKKKIVIISNSMWYYIVINPLPKMRLVQGLYTYKYVFLAFRESKQPPTTTY